MVKFSELFEHIGYIEEHGTCSCCGKLDKGLHAYTREGELVLLCWSCNHFLQELLE